MLKAKRKGILTLLIITGIILSMLLVGIVFQNGEKALHADTVGEWNDFAATGIVLLDSEQPNSVNNPYIISSAEELAFLALHVNNGERYTNQFFLQTAHIDLSGHYFTPIGFGEGREFNGIYDGNSYEISNLYINKPLGNNVGLFGSINTTVDMADPAGTIKNTNVVSGTISASGPIGGIVGRFTGKKIINCSSAVTITNSTSSAQNVGGIVGYSNKIVENCSFTGIINLSNTSAVGGIVGISDTNSKVRDSFSAATITAGSYVGGIVGRNYGEITNVYSSSIISAENYAGGLVGLNDGGIESGYFIGESNFTEYFSGAIIGQNNHLANAERLYYNKSTSNIGNLNRRAIGQNYQLISNANDDITNDVVGLEYYEMIGLSNGMSLDENKWEFSQNTETKGYAAYLSEFGIGVKEYSAVPLFGGDYTSLMWGEEAEPYQIGNPNQFVILGENINDKDLGYDNKYFELTNDIDFSAITDYKPIGKETNRFNSNLDGKNYELKNLTIDSTSNYVALFAFSSGTIKNMIINNFSINGGFFVATLAADIFNGVISNIVLKNSSINGINNVGGIAGYVYSTAISDILVETTTIVANNYYAGGIAGYAEEASSINKAFVDAEITGNEFAGGIVGLMNIGTIEESYFMGSISATNYAGGLAGYLLNSQVTKSFVYTEEIVGVLASGGISGGIDNTTIQDCYVVSDIIANNYAGGIVGLLDNGSIIDRCYFSGDVRFDTNGYTIGYDYSGSITNTYYNSDLLTNDSITLNGTAKNMVELSNNFDLLGTNFVYENKDDYYGYLPQLDYFHTNKTILSRAGTRVNYFFEGNGSQSIPYKISEQIHLVNMQRLIERFYADYNDKYYELISDITLIKEFIPIASFDNPFYGRLIGNYYSIYNLYINQPSMDYVGLFSRIGINAYVTKLNIRPVVVSATVSYGSINGRNNVGSIAGYSEGYIWDCMNNTDITGIDYVGGISGSATNIARCFNTAAITGDSYVGGIVGEAQSSVQQVFNSGYIKANVNYGGGIAGRNTVLPGRDSATVEIAYNSGDIESYLVGGQYTGTIKGGIVGINEAGATVRNAYNIATFKGANGFIAGGIIGENNSIAVLNSYYNYEVAEGFFAIGSGEESGSNVIGLTTIQMVGAAAFSNMVFSAGNFVSNEERGMDADFAPQLSLFYNKTVLSGENSAIIEIIKNYSKQSVMLRLFGRDVNNLMEWGGEQNPYLVATFDHLDTLSKQVQDNYTFNGKYFLVTDDIEIGHGFLPIGSYHIITPSQSIVFAGHFDGGGFSISQLNLANSTYSQGLFGYISAQSSVRNVVIASGNIFGSEKVGSVVGYSLGEVTRCYSSASVTGTTSVGGIVGQLRANQLSHSLFEGTVFGNSNWGGIVGLLENTTAGVYNCWYALDINAQYSHNNIGSLLYIDKNGNVNAGVDYTATDIKDFIYFEFIPNSGFGFDIRNISHTLIPFSTGGLVGNRYYPMYNSNAYIGATLRWYARFTKTVTIGAIVNGEAFGGGNFFEGQSVSIIVNPRIGNRLILTGEYTYAGDGETIICTRLMPANSWTFNADLVAFGNGVTEIVNPLGVQATIDSDSFEYDGLPKVYNVNINDFTTIEEYYRVPLNIKEDSAIVAGNYLLIIKLQLGSVIVGLKHINFTIVPLKLKLDRDEISKNESLTVKQYDKFSYDTISIPSSVITGVVGNDEIILTAVRRYYNDSNQQDPNIGDEKYVTFHEFILSGSGAINYSVPDNIVISKWFSELYERHISGYGGTSVNIRYDDSNPFGMIAGDFGEIASLYKHTSKTASDSTVDAFNSLSELFATFMENFNIPTDGTEYIPTIGSNALNNYTLFYNKAIELYDSSLVSFTKNISNNFTSSAVIGVNHPYTMTFGTDINPELINFQTIIANLFGFSSKTEFMNYAQNLANTYAQHRTNISNSVATDEALENGCFYASNGSFVFPIAVKNKLSSTVLAYVILDTSGLVSVWVNDITAALWATNFNSSYHTNSIIDNELYSKNILFVTGPIKIIKREVFIRILSDVLTKQYDGNPPLIVAHSFEGDLGDGLFVNEFSFTRVGATGWNIGKYIVGLTENISGSKDNYDIKFIQEYEFEITPKIISNITFLDYQNLKYTGFVPSPAITAKYADTANSFAQAQLTFYHNNQPITECINAGTYIAKASISDENFLLDSEKSINFVISKIAQPTPLILDNIDNNTYALKQVALSLDGGDGDGAISYEVLQGPVTISQGTLFINGTGNISIRAVKAESTNYFRQFSNTVNFVITKGVLTAVVHDVFISYGDTPIVEIHYHGYLRNEHIKEEIEGLIEPEYVVVGENYVVNSEGYEILLRDNGSADGYIIDVSQVSSRLYVMKKQIHILADPVSKIYGSGDPNITYSILEDNSIALNGIPKRVVGEGAGRYLIEQNSLTSENNPNYNIVYVPSYFTIYPKELRISIPIYTKTYGTDDPIAEFLIDEGDLRLGDNFSVLSGTITRDEGENVGQYSYKYANVTAGKNYTVRFTQVRYLRIQKANPVFTTPPKASAIVYGDTLTKAKITGEASVYGNFLWNDTSAMPSVFNSQNTVYEATFVPSNSANYNSLTFGLKLTVSPRNISVAFLGNTSFVYDGTDKANFRAVAYNSLEQDNLNLNISYSHDYLINAGNYYAQASINDINYYITGNDIVYITIAKSQLNISVKNETIVECGDYTPEIIFKGFKGMDTKEVLISQPYVLNIPSAPGSYNLMLDGADADNYLITYSTGKLTINRKSIKTEKVEIIGTMPYNANVGIEEMSKDAPAFVMMKDFVSSSISLGSQKGMMLESYNNITYDDALAEEMTFKILLAIDPNTPLILHHNDGSISILTDYKYEDGYVTFEASNLSGIGVLREATFYEKYGIYSFFAGICVISIFGSLIIVNVIKRAKKKKERLTPKFKD